MHKPASHTDPFRLNNLSDQTEIRIRLKNGHSFSGTLQRSAGWPWLSIHGQEPFSLSPLSPDFSQIDSLVAVSHESSVAEAGASLRKPGFIQPLTRDQFETTLWELALAINEARKQVHIDRPDYVEKNKCVQRVEDDFDQLADQLQLAKTKRRYIRFMALRRSRGEPLLHPLDLMGSPIDARAVEVPKHNDFHPDRRVRRSRSARPAIAYPTKKEVLSSLRDAQYRLGKGSLSKQAKAKFERIVEKRKKELQNQQFREAIAILDQKDHSSADCLTNAQLGFQYANPQNHQPLSKNQIAELAHQTSQAVAGPQTDTQELSTEHIVPAHQALELNL
jgi:hypothetical protein